MTKCAIALRRAGIIGGHQFALSKQIFRGRLRYLLRNNADFSIQEILIIFYNFFQPILRSSPKNESYMGHNNCRQICTLNLSFCSHRVPLYNLYYNHGHRQKLQRLRLESNLETLYNHPAIHSCGSSFSFAPSSKETSVLWSVTGS